MKLLKSALALVLAVALCCVSAFALTSKEDGAEMTGPESMTLTETSVTMSEETAAELVDAIAELEDEVDTDNLVVGAQFDMTIAEEDLPADVTFTQDAAEGCMMFVFNFRDGAWVEIGHGVGPSLTLTVTHCSPFAIVYEAEPTDEEPGDDTEEPAEDEEPGDDTDAGVTDTDTDTDGDDDANGDYADSSAGYTSDGTKTSSTSSSKKSNSKKSNSKSSASDPSGKSPKTGENDAMLIGCGIVLAAGAAAFFVSKKKA